MADDSQTPRLFGSMRALSMDRSTVFRWDDSQKSRAYSLGIHILVFVLLVAGPLANWLDEPFVPGDVQIRFYTPGGKGVGGGGGGGGSGGKKRTAYIPTKAVNQKSEEVVKPRQAPVAPRKPRLLVFDELDVQDVPLDTITAGIFSPDEVQFPGLSLEDAVDRGGVDTTRSAGEGRGIGGGDGRGVGSGTGWGVGPGRGGGFGGGDYSPGAWDIEPVLVFKPPDPEYPDAAREKMVSGEVILRILVRLDGSTEVLGVIKSLPYCVEAAKDNARLFRWKPALKAGKPVEAPGIITVTFDIFSRGNSRSGFR